MRRSLMLVAAGLLLPLMTGCATNGPGVIRGQNPDVGPDYGMIQPAGMRNNSNGPYFDNQGVIYNDGSGAFCDSQNCGRDFCAPRQAYRYKYVVPQGLSYPDQNAMPGVVQYPYYTFKGPDCFFHQ